VGDQIPAFQDFTAYSFNWMPEKIETELATDFSWSSTEWTDILELSFECESKMLLFIHAYTNGNVFNATGSAGTVNKAHYLTIDGNSVPATDCIIGGYCPNNAQFSAPYSVHAVAIVEKGSHTLKIRMRAMVANTTAWAFDRRLTIIKGFYQGGTS
jgi:hypothetical protein